MRLLSVRLRQTALTVILVLFGILSAYSQSIPPQARIAGAIDDSIRVTLKGNTHPLARPEFDRGMAPDDHAYAADAAPVEALA